MHYFNALLTASPCNRLCADSCTTTDRHTYALPLPAAAWPMHQAVCRPCTTPASCAASNFASTSQHVQQLCTLCLQHHSTCIIFNAFKCHAPRSTDCPDCAATLVPDDGPSRLFIIIVLSLGILAVYAPRCTTHDSQAVLMHHMCCRQACSQAVMHAAQGCS